MFMKLFTWWNSTTLGALFDIRRRSDFVGEDEYGNRYYEDRRSSLDDKDYYRRYVIYRGLAEPSKVPAEWHGWLHHTFDEPPTEAPLKRKAWETDHTPNMTGTLWATKPKGAISADRSRQAADSDYEAWTPDA